LAQSFSVSTVQSELAYHLRSNMGCSQSAAANPLLPQSMKSTKQKTLLQSQTAAKQQAVEDAEPWDDDESCHNCERPAQICKLFSDEQNLNDRLVSVIVTIYEGSSYDPMFREVTPTTVPGERVSTYSLCCSDVGKLHNLLAETTATSDDEGVWRSLVEDVHGVPSDSVVFNWECCSGCGDHMPFPCSAAAHSRRSWLTPQLQPLAASPSVTMQFMSFALRSGFTIMCSDFSLKSLIHEWSEEALGPNPFLQVGSCDQEFCLEFVPSELQHEEVPQQLQVVGELCADRGKAVVKAMPQTILYTVNPVRTETPAYNLKVLTVVTDYADPSGEVPIQEEAKCVIGQGETQKKGLAGHVTLTYAEGGGQLVTSMGHWMELSQIDASVESVMRAARHNFGSEELSKFQDEWTAKGSAEERKVLEQEACHKYLTMSVPSRMKQRTKY